MTTNLPNSLGVLLDSMFEHASLIIVIRMCEVNVKLKSIPHAPQVQTQECGQRQNTSIFVQDLKK